MAYTINGAIPTTGITHGGKFHADDILSTCLLRYSFPEIKISRVNRVSSDMTLENGVIVYDVGGGEFDHHPRRSSGKTTRNVLMRHLDCYGL